MYADVVSNSVAATVIICRQCFL